jgi:hypothetical protein
MQLTYKYFIVCSLDVERDLKRVGLGPSREIGARAPHPRTPHTDGAKERKGRVMHEVAVLTIWFALNIAGMMLTMLMSHICADSPGSRRKHDQLVRVPSEDGITEERTAMVRMGKAA